MELILKKVQIGKNNEYGEQEKPKNKRELSTD